MELDRVVVEKKDQRHTVCVSSRAGSLECRDSTRLRAEFFSLSPVSRATSFTRDVRELTWSDVAMCVRSTLPYRRETYTVHSVLGRVLLVTCCMCGWNKPRTAVGVRSSYSGVPLCDITASVPTLFPRPICSSLVTLSTVYSWMSNFHWPERAAARAGVVRCTRVQLYEYML